MTPRRILVLDAWSPIALIACRSLSRAGHHVGVSCLNRMDITTASKHVWRVHRLPPREGPAEHYIDQLLETIRRWSYHAVIAVTDPTVARLIEVPLPVPSCPCSSPEILPLIDKLDLANICRAGRVAYPVTFAPSSAAEDEASLSAAGFPAFVKARRSATPTAERVVHVTGARRVDDFPRGARALAALRAAGAQPIVQESVDGAKLHAVIIRRGGHTLFRYAHRFLRDLAGWEVALETVAAGHGVGGEAVAMLERAADAAGYEGLLQAEFYLAQRDGRLYLFDVNPRLWGSTWFPERLGLRVVERAVRDALGEPPLGDGSYRAGLRGHNLLGELRWARSHPDGVHSIVRTSRLRDVYYPGLGDPLPIAMWVLRRLGSMRGRGLVCASSLKRTLSSPWRQRA